MHLVLVAWSISPICECSLLVALCRLVRWAPHLVHSLHPPPTCISLFHHNLEFCQFGLYPSCFPLPFISSCISQKCLFLCLVRIMLQIFCLRTLRIFSSGLFIFFPECEYNFLISHCQLQQVWVIALLMVIKYCWKKTFIAHFFHLICWASKSCLCKKKFIVSFYSYIIIIILPFKMV